MLQRDFRKIIYFNQKKYWHKIYNMLNNSISEIYIVYYLIKNAQVKIIVIFKFHLQELSLKLL